MTSEATQPVVSDADSLDVSIALQLLFTLPEKDWRESAVGHLTKSPSYLWPLESADRRINIAEVISRWPYDTTEVPLHPTAVDPREVLSILAALSETVKSYMLYDYLILLLNAYRQVLFGNMRRRLKNIKEQSSSPKGVLHARNSVLLSMKPWTQDILEVLEKHILPGLVVQDANPQSVETDIDCNGTGRDSTVRAHIDGSQSADCEGSHPAAESSRRINIGHIKEPGTVFALIVDLLQDMVHSSTLHDACARCAVALYGVMWSSMSLCCALTIGGVSVLERIQGEYQRVSSKTPSSDFSKGVVLPSEGFVFSSSERAAFRGKILGLLCKALELESPAEALFQLLCDEMGDPPPEHSRDPYYFSDWEEGNRPPISKTLTLWQKRERALGKLQLWDFSESHFEEHSDFFSDGGISVMVNLGLFFLSTSLLFSRKESPLLISSSPLSFFFMISSALSVSLKCPSAAALLGVLLFLAQCVRRIPKYCIEFPGERRDLGNPIDRAEEASGYRTERYRIFFELLKQLVSISVMCPNAIHRTLSRSLTLELLKCLEERARIRTHMTLLALSPFGSVARVLLDSALSEWDFSLDARHAGLSSALLSDMPCGVVNAMRSFLQHIERGRPEFIDPLIVSLNFLRLFIIRDRSAAKSRMLIYDASGNLILTEDCVDEKRTSENNSWPWAIRCLKKTILPNCRQFLSLVSENSGQEATGPHKSFSPITLSPLEEFALSSAVDGVSVLLHVAERSKT